MKAVTPIQRRCDLYRDGHGLFAFAADQAPPSCEFRDGSPATDPSSKSLPTRHHQGRSRFCMSHNIIIVDPANPVPDTIKLPLPAPGFTAVGKGEAHKVTAVGINHHASAQRGLTTATASPLFTCCVVLTLYLTF